MLTNFSTFCQHFSTKALLKGLARVRRRGGRKRRRVRRYDRRRHTARPKDEARRHLWSSQIIEASGAASATAGRSKNACSMLRPQGERLPAPAALPPRKNPARNPLPAIAPRCRRGLLLAAAPAHLLATFPQPCSPPRAVAPTQAACAAPSQDPPSQDPPLSEPPHATSRPLPLQ